MTICLFCNIEFKFIQNHSKYCKLNPDRIKKPGKYGWNKGLTKETDNRIKPSKLKGRKGLTTGRALTPEREIERIRKIREATKLKNNGGFKIGSGRGKGGWYKGIFCHSSWELAFVIYHIDNNIAIRQCKDIRYYEWTGERKRYYPDFIVNGEIIEIKGYKTKQWEAKLKDNPDIIVLYQKDMKKYIDYTVLKYGKNYIQLYDKYAGE